MKWVKKYEYVFGVFWHKTYSDMHSNEYYSFVQNIKPCETIADTESTARCQAIEICIS